MGAVIQAVNDVIDRLIISVDAVFSTMDKPAFCPNENAPKNQHQRESEAHNFDVLGKEAGVFALEIIFRARMKWELQMRGGGLLIKAAEGGLCLG